MINTNKKLDSGKAQLLKIMLER